VKMVSYSVALIQLK